MSTFAAEMNKLKNIQHNLEKSDQSVFDQIERMEFASKHHNFFKQFDTSSNAEFTSLQTNIKSIRNPIKNVKRTLKLDKLGPTDIHNVKKDMTYIKESLETLQDNAKVTLETLEKEERKLTDEFKALEERIDEWSQPSTLFHLKKPIKKISTKAHLSENLSQEVKEYLDFVEKSGGHENRWRLEDHNLFLKVRDKVKEPEKIAEILHTILPDISEEEIVEHEKWYQKYLELKEKQKNSIKNWKEAKISLKSATVAKTSKKTRHDQKQRSTSCVTLNYNKEFQQEQLLQWKSERQAKIEKQKQEEVENKQKDKEKMKKWQQQNQETKKKVTEWKSRKNVAEKEEMMRRLKAEEEIKEYRAALANKLIKQYRTQDQFYIQKMKEIRELEAVPQMPFYRQLFASRDPKRLLKPTKQWMNRTLSCENTGSSTMPLNLNMAPRLAVPEWRKGI